MDASLILKSHLVLNLMDFENYDDDYYSNSTNQFNIIPDDIESQASEQFTNDTLSNAESNTKLYAAKMVKPQENQQFCSVERQRISINDCAIQQQHIICNQLNPELINLMKDLYQLKCCQKQISMPKQSLIPYKNIRKILCRFTQISNYECKFPLLKKKIGRKQKFPRDEIRQSQKIKNFPKFFIQTVIKQLYMPSLIQQIAIKHCHYCNITLEQLQNFANKKNLGKFGSLESIKSLWSQQTKESQVFTQICKEIREERIYTRIIMHSRAENKALYLSRIKQLLEQIETPDQIKQL